jgi:GNAT superfamily N-acetyltransferase
MAMHWKKDRFTISTDPTRLDLPYIHSFLSTKSYWSEGIPLETVKTSIDNSICFGLYGAGDGEGIKQIGFARVITDKTTFGYLADVFIDETHRGQGLSKWMIEIILSHPNCRVSVTGN